MRNAKLALGFAVALAMSGSMSALAQTPAPPAAAPSSAAPASTSTSTGTTSKQPVDITADQAEVQQEKRLTIWRGNVEAIQGQNRLRTPQLTVYFTPKQEGAAPAPKPAGTGDMGSIERMEAEGPVYFVTPTQTAKGAHGVYTASDDTIVLTGDVVLVQDRNVAKGDKLTVNQRTGQSVLVSNAKGRGAPNRVRGVFYPNDTATTGAAPANGTGPAAAPKAATPKAGGAR